MTNENEEICGNCGHEEDRHQSFYYGYAHINARCLDCPCKKFKSQSPLSQESVREKKKSDLIGVTCPFNKTSRDTQIRENQNESRRKE